MFSVKTFYNFSIRSFVLENGQHDTNIYGTNYSLRLLQDPCNYFIGVGLSDFA